jgi:hypothetical protein
LYILFLRFKRGDKKADGSELNGSKHYPNLVCS